MAVTATGGRLSCCQDQDSAKESKRPHTFRFRRKFKCGFLLSHTVGVQHRAGIIGEILQRQPAGELKQSLVCPFFLHCCILCHLLTVPIKPANLSSWVAAAGGALQIAACVYRCFGDDGGFAISGCRDRQGGQTHSLGLMLIVMMSSDAEPDHHKTCGMWVRLKLKVRARWGSASGGRVPSFQPSLFRSQQQCSHEGYGPWGTHLWHEVCCERWCGRCSPPRCTGTLPRAALSCVRCAGTHLSSVSRTPGQTNNLAWPSRLVCYNATKGSV